MPWICMYEKEGEWLVDEVGSGGGSMEGRMRRKGKGKGKSFTFTFTYPIRSQKRHPHRDPPALTRAQHKGLLDAQRLHHLQVHDGRVPVREVLALGARLAVPEQLDGQQVHRVRQLLVAVLLAVQLRRGGEGVDEHERRLRGVVGIGHLVAGFDAAQVRDLNGFGVGHCWWCACVF